MKKRYAITKRFTTGLLRGITLIEETDVKFQIGERVEKPVAGSAYVIENVFDSNKKKGTTP